VSEDAPADDATPAQQEPEVEEHSGDSSPDNSDDGEPAGSEIGEPSVKDTKEPGSPISDAWNAPDSVSLGLRVYCKGVRAVVGGQLV
jgi:hypothetical protein